MDEPLSDVEVRVLGSLIEKERTTPDYYPLSLNALTAACNQSSNRSPVVRYDEETVARGIESLRKRSFARGIPRMDSRVIKYRHLLAEALNLEARDLAVMCELMLRGPQTVGEVKSRASRMVDFASSAEVETTLELLSLREPALVVRLARKPGQKEVRYAHLLAGDVSYDAPDPAAARVSADVDRIAVLEEVTQELRREVADLRAQLDAFRKQFE